MHMVRRHRLNGVVFVVSLGMNLAPALLFALEEGEAPQAAAVGDAAEAPTVARAEEPAVDYAYGTVVELSADHLVVSEYDEVAGTTANVTYTVDPQVTLYEVQSLAEVAVGDEVDVDYVIKDGGRYATAIAVAKIAQDDVEQGAEEP